MTETWYSYREIRFTKQQVLWILEHAATLREGYWPKEPIISGYIEPPNIKKKGSKEGYFTKAVETIAEVENRLERAGLDGLILEAIECWGKSEESLSKYLRVSEWVVRRRYKRALNFVAGWKRK